MSDSTTCLILLEVEDGLLASVLRSLKPIPGIAKVTFDAGQGDLEMPVKIGSGSYTKRLTELPKARAKPKSKSRPKTSMMGPSTKTLFGMLNDIPISKDALAGNLAAAANITSKDAYNTLFRAHRHGLIKYLPEGTVHITGRGKVAKEALFPKVDQQ